MNIKPWRRRDELAGYHDHVGELLNRFFDGDGSGWPTHLPDVFTFPRVNMAETEAALIIEAELPGMDEKDIELQLMGETLVLSGERTWSDETKQKEYYRVESEYGRFRREVPLPPSLRLDRDGITATYAQGVLKIVLPKQERTPAARIPVEAAKS